MNNQPQANEWKPRESERETNCKWTKQHLK